MNIYKRLLADDNKQWWEDRNFIIGAAAGLFALILLCCCWSQCSNYCKDRKKSQYKKWHAQKKEAALKELCEQAIIIGKSLEQKMPTFNAEMMSTRKLEKPSWQSGADKKASDKETLKQKNLISKIRDQNHEDAMRILKNVLDPEDPKDHKYFCKMFEAQHYPFKFVSTDYSPDMV